MEILIKLVTNGGCYISIALVVNEFCIVLFQFVFFNRSFTNHSVFSWCLLLLYNLPISKGLSNIALLIDRW